MSNAKRKINKTQWTNFWNDLGVYERKPQRFLKHYNFQTDIRKLRRIGVDSIKVKEISSTFNNYKEPLLQFHKFVTFFRKDPDTVMDWIGTTDVTDSFTKLFKRLHNNSYKKAKKNYQQLFLLYELNKKGEGKGFELKYTGKGSIKKIKGRVFSSLLSSKYENATYEGISEFKEGKYTIIGLRKNSQGKSVYKFIKILKEHGKIKIDLSFDSQKEFNLVKFRFGTWFQSYLDTPEVQGNFTHFTEFVKKGESQHFLLIGINYFDNGFKISVFPQYNRHENIATYGGYKKRFSAVSQGDINTFSDVRISNKEITTKGQVFVRFSSDQTGGVIGGIVLRLDDRRLNMKERKKLKEDFEEDFGLPLGKLIRLDTVSDEEIFKIFLQNTPKRSKKLELRSEQSLKIYKKLLEEKLLSLQFELRDDARFCFDSNCRLSYQLKWNQKTCRGCGGLLFNDKKIVISAIDEAKVADFIFNVCKGVSLHVERFERKLILRKIFVVEVRNGEKSACFIPITRSLDDNQLEILRFRYPNAVVITSKEDSREISVKNIEVIELYKFAPKLLNEDRRYINTITNKIFREGLQKIRTLSNDSSARLLNDTFYKDKNRIAKNFGAELFEADSSILLGYIFGNSIWLGARKRGSAFPDGITALPLTKSKNGCFISDTKFSEGTRIPLGTEDKNKKYVKDGKKNSTIIENGGLKGFVFISNIDAPSNFVLKYKKVVKGSRAKISHIKSESIMAIFNHFKDNESDINNNNDVKHVFIEGMKKVFFSTAGNKKGQVLRKQYIDNVLSQCVTDYQQFRTQAVSV